MGESCRVPFSDSKLDRRSDSLSGFHSASKTWIYSAQGVEHLCWGCAGLDLPPEVENSVWGEGVAIVLLETLSCTTVGDMPGQRQHHRLFVMCVCVCSVGR